MESLTDNSNDGPFAAGDFAVPDENGVRCPACRYPDNAASANYCSRCGTALRGPPCPDCESPSELGDRFCTACGVALGGTSGRVADVARRAMWAAGGVAGAILLVAVALPLSRGGERSPAAPPQAAQPGPASSTGALGPTSAVDLSSMTPRQAADRLFERVMTSLESGDTAQATLFLPMAIASYDRILALSLDDRFHLSLLHAAAADGASALAVAEAGLAVRPTHLLCLAAAARAALMVGDESTARAYYRTLVDSYADEVASGLPEYGSQAGHAVLLPVLLDEAREHLAAGTRS